VSRQAFRDIPTQTSETLEAYLAGGYQLLRRALRGAPHSAAISALSALFGDPRLVLRSSTTRTYACHVRAVLQDLVERGELSKDQVERGLPHIEGLLKARRGRRAKATSAKKLKVGDMHEYITILKDFTNRKQNAGKFDTCDHTLFRLLALSPHFGLRPSEWLNVWIEDGKVIAKNAKATNGRAGGDKRTFQVDKMPPLTLRLVSELVISLRALFLENGENWRRTLGLLAERLARVCARLKLRRWSLYTFRHIAIASWKQAEFTLEQIAAMAGHGSLKTARKHYAGSRSGWGPKYSLVQPSSDRLVPQANAEEPDEHQNFGMAGSP
jgi:hypothetical protein